MALAFPEGECFFNRNALQLKGEKSGAYDPNNPEHFYSHIMIEFNWNVSPGMSHFSIEDLQTGIAFPWKLNRKRSIFQVVYHDGVPFFQYTQLPVQYGPRTQPTRRVQHNLCTSGGRLWDQRRGASIEPWFMMLPMPTKEERWIWIDLLASIRAIYFPLCIETGPQYPGLCTFVQLNFARHGKMNVKYSFGDPVPPIPIDLDLSLVWGLNWQLGNTLGIDVTEIMTLLAIPRNFRSKSLQDLSLVLLCPEFSVPDARLTDSFRDEYDISWQQVAGANYGVAVQWVPPKPAEKSWFSNFFKNIVSAALGFIPGVGPLLSAGFALAWTAITDPDEFARELRDQFPMIDLGLYINESTKSAQDVKKYLDVSWVSSGQMIYKPEASSRQSTAAAEPVVPMTTEELGKIGPDSAFAARFEYVANYKVPEDQAFPALTEEQLQLDTVKAAIKSQEEQAATRGSRKIETYTAENSPYNWAVDYIKEYPAKLAASAK